MQHHAQHHATTTAHDCLACCGPVDQLAPAVKCLHHLHHLQPYAACYWHSCPPSNITTPPPRVSRVIQASEPCRAPKASPPKRSAWAQGPPAWVGRRRPASPRMPLSSGNVGGAAYGAGRGGPTTPANTPAVTQHPAAHAPARPGGAAAAAPAQQGAMHGHVAVPYTVAFLPLCVVEPPPAWVVQWAHARACADMDVLTGRTAAAARGEARYYTEQELGLIANYTMFYMGSAMSAFVPPPPPPPPPPRRPMPPSACYVR